jgi:trehalose-6-phosphatase
MKSKLLEKLKNPKGLILCVDLDGTLSEGSFLSVEEPQPLQRMIDLLGDWYLRGACIIIWTGRQDKYYAETKSWLIKHNVAFHGIAMRHKPHADIYIDDKGLNVCDIM